MGESTGMNGLALRTLAQNRTPPPRNRVFARRVGVVCMFSCLIVQWCVWSQAAWSGTSDELRIALEELEQMRWDVPRQWRVVGGTRIGTLPNRVHTFMITDATGRSIVTKVGQSADRTP